MNLHKAIKENRKINNRLIRGLDVSDNIEKVKEYASRSAFADLVCDGLVSCVECQYLPERTNDNCINYVITPCALTGVTNTNVTYNTNTQILSANFSLAGSYASTTQQVYKNSTAIATPTTVTSNTTSITLPLTYAEFIDNQLLTKCKFRNTNCVIDVNIPRVYSCANRGISSIISSQVITGRTWFKIGNTMSNSVGNVSWSYTYPITFFDQYTNNNEVFVSPKFSQYINVLNSTQFIGVTATDEFNCAKTEQVALFIAGPSIVLGTITTCRLSPSAIKINIPYTITNSLSDPTEVKSVFTSLSGATTISDSQITIELVSPLTNNLSGTINIGYVGSSTVWDSENFNVSLDNINNACVV